MRIISDFHDYYDIGLQYGIDPKCIYNRKTENIELPDIFPSLLHGGPRNGYCFYKNGKATYYEKIIISFCAEIYTYLYRIDYTTLNHDYIYFPTFESFKNDFDSNKLENTKHYWTTGSVDKVERFYNRQLKQHKYSYETRTIPTKERLIELHRELKTPIIDIANSRKDPVLKNIRFASLVDPYTAFQELSMFITNTLGIGEPETIEIEDKYKIVKFGYNDKSFKHPNKLKDL
jgi:hypothetical protein